MLIFQRNCEGIKSYTNAFALSFHYFPFGAKSVTGANPEKKRQYTTGGVELGTPSPQQDLFSNLPRSGQVQPCIGRQLNIIHISRAPQSKVPALIRAAILTLHYAALRPTCFCPFGICCTVKRMVSARDLHRYSVNTVHRQRGAPRTYPMFCFHSSG